MYRAPALKPLSRLVAAALLPSGLMCIAPALAQDATAVTLKPVVVTGSRVEAESFDLPYSVDVVDMRGTQEGNLRVNASEALNGVPGLVIQNRQNYAQDLQISVRARRIRRPASASVFPSRVGANLSTSPLNASRSCALLRTVAATMRAIQLFSRDGRPLRITGGSEQWPLGRRRFVLAEGEKNRRFVDASRLDTDGYRDHSEARRDQAFAKITLKPDEDSKLTLVGSGLRQKDTEDPLGVTWETYKRDPRAVEQVARDFNTRKSIDHLQGGVTYERRFGQDRLQLSAYSGTRSVTQ